MMNNKIIVDASPLVAILSPRDNYHLTCVNTLKNIKPSLLTTYAVITEVLWLVRSNKMAINGLFSMVEGGLVTIDLLSDDAVSWLKVFMLQYYDMGVQLADASLCYLAEKYQIDTVFTLDRRDFLIYRIKGNKSLQVIP
jgi:uncharacterized protein